MKLADLIDRLVEIHNSEVDYNPEVSVMTEVQLKDGTQMQVEHKVTDVATSKRNNRLIIIGQELD